jgi:hypothetical protein
MAYIKTEISNYGTRFAYMQSLRNFFANNSVAPFEVIAEPTTENPTLTVERNNLNITLEPTIVSSGGVTKITVRTKTADGSYATNMTSGTTAISSSDVFHSRDEYSTTAVLTRAVQIFLLKNEDSILLQVGAFNATSPSTGVTILDCTLTNGLNLVGAGLYDTSTLKTSMYLKESQSQSKYTIRPYHTGTNDDTKLILSNSLAVNNSSGVYNADVIGLKSAGGAKQFGCYVTDTDSYYAVFNDVVIALGERLEYTNEVS